MYVSYEVEGSPLLELFKIGHILMSLLTDIFKHCFRAGNRLYSLEMPSGCVYFSDYLLYYGVMG